MQRRNCVILRFYKEEQCGLCSLGAFPSPALGLKLSFTIEAGWFQPSVNQLIHVSEQQAQSIR